MVFTLMRWLDVFVTPRVGVNINHAHFRRILGAPSCPPPPPPFLCVSEQLDPVLQGLDADMKVAGSEEDEQSLKKQIKSREDALLPMYLQVSKPPALQKPPGDTCGGGVAMFACRLLNAVLEASRRW